MFCTEERRCPVPVRQIVAGRDDEAQSWGPWITSSKSPEASNQKSFSADCCHHSCSAGDGGNDLGLVGHRNLAMIQPPLVTVEALLLPLVRCSA